jgi:ATP-dependent DNA ligase
MFENRFAPLELGFCKPITSLAGLTGSRWIMEPKLDGFRLQVIVEGDGRVSSYTRTNHVATGKLLAVETAIREVAPALAGTVLDGEAVYLDETGLADFNYTARVMGSGTAVAVQKQRESGKYVSFMAFDILYLRGQDVRSLPLKERRKLLERVVRAFDSEHVLVTPQAPASEAQHAFYTDMYGEGSVVKDLEAPYRAGRSKAMLKWKKTLTEDVVILGMEPGKGKFEGQVGAVVFGQYGTPNSGHKCSKYCTGNPGFGLHERGQCSGMDDDTRLAFTRNLPVGHVMEITHNGVLAGDKFRHPQFSRLRDLSDKAPVDCLWT